MNPEKKPAGREASPVLRWLVHLIIVYLALQCWAAQCNPTQTDGDDSLHDEGNFKGRNLQAGTPARE